MPKYPSIGGCGIWIGRRWCVEEINHSKVPFQMSFKLNRKSKNQLNRFAKSLLDDRGRIERYGKDEFVIWGDDKVLGTTSAVGVEVNKRGNITSLNSWTSGQSASRYDDQFYVFKVDDPREAVNFFARLSAKDSLGVIYADMTNPQPWADAFNKNVPGLAGGPQDVYVSFGEYWAFA